MFTLMILSASLLSVSLAGLLGAEEEKEAMLLLPSELQQRNSSGLRDV